VARSGYIIIINDLVLKANRSPASFTNRFLPLPFIHSSSFSPSTLLFYDQKTLSFKMQFIASLATALVAATSLVSATPVARGSLDVYAPAITSPKEGDSFVVNQNITVTWYVLFSQ
jgi:hypothetical protein